MRHDEPARYSLSCARAGGAARRGGRPVFQPAAGAAAAAGLLGDSGGPALSQNGKVSDEKNRSYGG